MARIRSIRPELWDSQKLGSLSVLARLTFIGLISLADDKGRGRADPRFLIGRIHAYDSSITIKTFKVALDELGTAKLVFFYENSGSKYYFLPGWKEHQKIEKPRDSMIPPARTVIGDSSPTPPRLLPDSSPTHRGRIGVDWSGLDRIGVDIPPLPPSGGDAGFDQFWKIYPGRKRKAKARALKAWNKIRPDQELKDKILAAVKAQSVSADWLKDGGQYIPLPATWLNDGSWENSTDDCGPDFLGPLVERVTRG